MQGVALFQYLERFESGAHDGGSHRVGEQVGAAALTEHVDNFLAAGGEATHGTAEGLAQRAGIDVDAAVRAEELAHAVTRGAHNAGRVALVHHDEGVILFGQIAYLVHRGYVAVHREDAVGHDDAEALCLGLLQATFQVGHVGVGVAVALGLAQAHAVDDGGVVEGVRDDGVVGREQGLKHAAVGIEASGVENGVLGLEIVGDGGFELFVHVLRATDEANRRHTVTAAVHHVLGRLNEARMVGKAQIVVGAEVEHLLAGHLDGSLLRPLYEAFGLVEAGFLDLLQLVLKVCLKFSVHI